MSYMSTPPLAPRTAAGLNATPRRPPSGQPSARSTPRKATVDETNVATRLANAKTREEKVRILQQMKTRADNLRAGEGRERFNVIANPYEAKLGKRELSNPVPSEKLWAHLRKLVPDLGRQDREDHRVRHPVEGAGRWDGHLHVNERKRESMLSAEVFPGVGRRKAGELDLTKLGQRHVAPPSPASREPRPGRARVPEPPSYSSSNNSPSGTPRAQTPQARRRLAPHPSSIFGGAVEREQKTLPSSRAHTPRSEGDSPSRLRSRSTERRSYNPVTLTRSRSADNKPVHDPFDEVPKGSGRRSHDEAAKHHAKQPDNWIADPRKPRKGYNSQWGAYTPANHDIFGFSGSGTSPVRAHTPQPRIGVELHEPFGIKDDARVQVVPRQDLTRSTAASRARSAGPRQGSLTLDHFGAGRDANPELAAGARRVSNDTKVHPRTPSARSPARGVSPSASCGDGPYPTSLHTDKTTVSPTHSDGATQARRVRSSTPPRGQLSLANFGAPRAGACGVFAPNRDSADTLLSANRKGRAMSPQRSLREAAEAVGMGAQTGMSDASPRRFAKLTDPSGVAGMMRYQEQQRGASPARAPSATTAPSSSHAAPSAHASTAVPRGRTASPAAPAVPARRAPSPTLLSTGVAGAFSWDI